MMFLQAVAVLFAFFMLYVVRLHFIKKNLVPFEYGIWVAIWVTFVVLAIFPQTMAGLAETLHIARVFDLLVILSLMVIVYLTFMNRISYHRLEKKLEEIIRKRALDEKK